MSTTQPENRKVKKETWLSLIDPVVGARGRILLVLVDVDLEALAIAFVLPVRDGVADVVEERTAAKVEIADKHAAEMTDVADVVSAGSERGEEFDGPHHRNVGAHRDCDWKGNQP